MSDVRSFTGDELTTRRRIATIKMADIGDDSELRLFATFDAAWAIVQALAVSDPIEHDDERGTVYCKHCEWSVDDNGDPPDHDDDCLYVLACNLVAQFGALDVVAAPPPSALHASAPAGHKCADCSIDGEPCPDCYAVAWRKRHPRPQQPMRPSTMRSLAAIYDTLGQRPTEPRKHCYSPYCFGEGKCGCNCKACGNG